MGVDGAKACSQDAGFRLADGLGGGYELAIDIRRLHDVGVDDGHTTDACAGDELGCEATDTAETDDEHVTLGELAHAIVTEEEAGTLGPRLGRESVAGAGSLDASVVEGLLVALSIQHVHGEGGGEVVVA